MNGFKTMDRRRLARDVADVGDRGEVFMLQQLPAENLQPNSEYIIWFGFNEGGVPKLTLSLNVFPAGVRYTYKDTFPLLYQERSDIPAAGDGK